MSLPRRMLGRLAVCLLLSVVVARAGDKPKDKDPPAKLDKVEFKGQAKVSAHPDKMQKGEAYRITVKSDGFVPKVRIEGQPATIRAWRVRRSCRPLARRPT